MRTQPLLVRMLAVATIVLLTALVCGIRGHTEVAIPSEDPTVAEPFDTTAVDSDPVTLERVSSITGTQAAVGVYSEEETIDTLLEGVLCPLMNGSQGP